MSRLGRLQLLGQLPRAAMAPSQRPIQVRGAWTFTAGMAIDCDGAPNAYALPGSGRIGLDAISNAGYMGHWVGLACDNAGKPYIQGTSDPAPGYAVSQTALQDHSRPLSSPSRYVDADKVPYIVTPPELMGGKGVRLGDLAVALRLDRIVFCIVADIGPHSHYGEASMAAARPLNIDDNPRSGGCSSGVTYVIFPGSAATPAWPRSVLEFQADAARRYADWKAAV